jgi:ubiquinone/menaquinone biosynthesis C-methylase UbiE
MSAQRNDDKAPRWTRDVAGRRVRTLTEGNNYFLPGDLEERARLKLQHDLMWLVWGKLYYAPLHPYTSIPGVDSPARPGANTLPLRKRPAPKPRFPRSIIDVACGDALWGYQMALAFPEARVVNLDNDPVHFRALVKRNPLPNNFEFHWGDALQWPLLFPNGSFHFVHSRFPDTFLSHERFPGFLRELDRICRPDGWVEIVVADYPTIGNPSEVVKRYYQAALDLPIRMGLCGAGGPRLSEYFEQAGIKRYRHRTRLVGQKPIHKQLLLDDIFAALKGMKGYFDALGLLPLAEFKRNWRQFCQDLMQHEYTMQFHRVWWQPARRNRRGGWLDLARAPLPGEED